MIAEIVLRWMRLTYFSHSGEVTIESVQKLIRGSHFSFESTKSAFDEIIKVGFVL